MAIFTDVICDVTKEGRKLPTNEYKDFGLHPIIDQGQNDIAGYTDETDGLFLDVPAIVFGDHTRIIKYVDTPFFIGADGVKILKAKNRDSNYKFLYYALSSARIPNTGYNRHFKWLKEVEIPTYTEQEQSQIVFKLDKITSLIQARQEQLNKLEQLVKSRFIEMFGNLVIGDKFNTNQHKIGDIASVTKLAGFEFTKYIQYKEQGDIIMLRGLNCKKGHLVLDDIKWIDRETSNLLPRSKLYYGDILMTYAGTIGDVAMVDADDKYHLAPNVAKITLHDKENCNPLFLIHLFMYSHDYIMTFASQVAQASINMEKIRNFEYFFPPIDLQNQFAEFVEQTDKLKFEVKQSLEKLETLKKSLMQQYFG